MDIRPYLAAWIAYHEDESDLCFHFGKKCIGQPKISQEYAQLGQEHADLADYYINMLVSK